MHGQRSLKEIHVSSGLPVAKEDLDWIAQIYAIKHRFRGENSSTRQFVRWKESTPRVNALGVWLDGQGLRVSPRSRLYEKLVQFANHRTAR